MDYVQIAEIGDTFGTTLEMKSGQKTLIFSNLVLLISSNQRLDFHVSNSSPDPNISYFGCLPP